jgi:hypothetical protein
VRSIPFSISPPLADISHQIGGYYSSVRPGTGRIFLNLDLSSQPFIKSGNLAELIQDYSRLTSRGRLGPPVDVGKIMGRLVVDLNRFVMSFDRCCGLST